MNKKSITKLLLYIALISTTLIYLIPLLWMIVTSVKPQIDIFSIPPKLFFSPTVDHFRLIIEQWDIFHSFHNSLIISLSATSITVTVGTFAGYAIARLDFKNKQLMAFQILTVKIIPPIIACISLFLIGKALGLHNTRVYLILIYSVFNLPLAVWMTASFISDIPVAIEESALIDGCSRYSMFYKIIIPLVLPGLAAVFMLTFVFAWNELLFANILTSYETRTLPVIAASSVKPRGILWGAASASGILLVIPAFVVCFMAGKFIVRGLTFGAIK